MDLVINPYTFSALPTNSIDFELSSSQYLSMTDGNFGAYDRAKWAISVWYKLESAGTNRGIMSQYGAAGNRAFRFLFNTSNKLTILTSVDGTGANGTLTTTATYTDTTAYHHILFHYDSANATAGDRMRLWHDGTEVTAFDSDINPTAAIFNSTADIQVGAETASLGAYMDGLMYQMAFFSGSLPTIGQVYNAGAPMDVRSLTGLYAMLDVNGGSVVSDYVLATDWTNNNTAVASTTIP